MLGIVLYAAVATTLASASVNLLRDRAGLVSDQTVVGVATPVVGTGQIIPGVEGLAGSAGAATVVGANAGLPGLAVGGPYSGTIALVVRADDTAPVGPPPGGPLDPQGIADALAGRTSVRESTYEGTPVRVLSMPIPTTAAGGPAGVIQVVGDRTAELRTLAVLAAVLVGGGLAALAVAALLGALYATRALVPIRASLRLQREFAADTSHELPHAARRHPGGGRARAPAARRQRLGGCSAARGRRRGGRSPRGPRRRPACARADESGTADLDLRPVDLAEVAATALAALEPLATKRGVRLALDVEPAVMRGDADRLRRLVTVLVDNAIRHGREGGNVRVTVRAGSLVVEDDGPGIPPADRVRVFDRFWRGAGAAAGGSGLGLSIAGWIVDRHEGRIAVSESALGGARFGVTLPISGRFTNAS